MHLGVELVTDHMPGSWNGWGDDLSRGFLEGFDPARRRWPPIGEDWFWRTPLRRRPVALLQKRNERVGVKRPRAEES